jgi:hypothetical protein
VHLAASKEYPINAVCAVEQHASQRCWLQPSRFGIRIACVSNHPSRSIHRSNAADVWQVVLLEILQYTEFLIWKSLFCVCQSVDQMMLMMTTTLMMKMTLMLADPDSSDSELSAGVAAWRANPICKLIPLTTANSRSVSFMAFSASAPGWACSRPATRRCRGPQRRRRAVSRAPSF